ncbi:GNAT family N-acetyltransferase [Micromonospora sp. NPDC049366]|uniref:GNAT family N-acetyltransferase n=1 Tax=Micromonospora sp. NPDC049366 TaxID=3364271 RepID=UPI00378D031F
MTNTELTDALTEAAEAEFMHAYLTGTPAAARERLGIAAARIGGGVVVSMRHDPVNYWSKALGFGFTEPVTRELVDRVVAFYRAEGTREAVLQIAPSALPADWDDVRAAYGIEPTTRWVKLAAPIGRVRPGGGTRLRVGPVGAGDAAEWADVVLRGFGMPTAGGLAEMMAASVDDPRCHPYGVWDGPDLVAAANLFVHGPVGALNAGATLPSHRRLGAQSALIVARAEAARAAGCRWLVAETGKPAEGAVNQSLVNLERAGLRVRYARQNWRWRADADLVA